MPPLRRKPTGMDECGHDKSALGVTPAARDVVFDEPTGVRRVGNHGTATDSPHRSPRHRAKESTLARGGCEAFTHPTRYCRRGPGATTGSAVLVLPRQLGPDRQGDDTRFVPCEQG